MLVVDPTRTPKSRTRFAHHLISSSVGCWVGGRGGGVGRLVVNFVLSVSVVDLLAHLLGQGQLNGLAGGSGQLGDALLEGLGDLLNLGDGDALLLGEVLARDPGQGDGLVHTGLDGLGVDDIHWRLNNSDNWHIVASLLANLFAVVVAVAVPITISMGSWLADGHHLSLTLFLKRHLNCLSSGAFGLGLVGVGADLVVDLLGALGADGADHSVALLNILDALPAQLDGIADGLKGGGADLGSLDDIEHGAVVLGVLIPVVDCVVVRWGRLVVGWRGVVGGRLRGVTISWRGRGITSIGWGGGGMVGVRTKGQGGQSQQGNKLRAKSWLMGIQEDVWDICSLLLKIDVVFRQAVDGG